MKKLQKIATMLGVSALLVSASANAQIKFKVERIASLDHYVVSFIPEKAIADRLSIIGTAQVTVRVKSDENFSLANVESLVKDVEWDKGSVLRRPDGASGYDYISFGLKTYGTKAVKFEAGKEIAMFSFKNGNSNPSEVTLVDNSSDELGKFAKSEFNIKNHISVLGYGQINAYAGNMMAAKSAEKLIIQSLYPNPAADKTTVSWVNLSDETTGDVFLSIVDATTGREVLREKSATKAGEFRTSLNVEGLNVGNYLVFIERDGARVGKAQKLSVMK